MYEFIIIIIIIIFKNESEEVNLHELSYVETFKQVQVKLFSEYHDYLNIFNSTMINQLLFYHFYDHKINLINREILS